MSLCIRLAGIFVPSVSIALTMLIGCGRTKDANPSTTEVAEQRIGESVKEPHDPVPAVAPSDAQVGASSGASSDPGSLDREAIAMAWELFRQRWTPCGDTWISVQIGKPWALEVHGAFQAKRAKQLVELKGVDIRPVTQKPGVSEADRLNGVEWKGFFEFVFSAGRNCPLNDEAGHDATGAWSAWWSPPSGRPQREWYRLHLVKRNGVWAYTGAQMVDGYKKEYDPLGTYDGQAFSTVGCDEAAAIAAGTQPASSAASNPNGSRADALHLAVMAELVDEVKAILASGADVNAKWSMGTHPTALSAAITSDDDVRVQIVGALLDAGADPNLADDSGQTPLMLATAANAKRISLLLLAHDADVNKSGERGRTALHVAAASPDVSAELVRILLKAGADINARIDDTRWTPLTMAKMSDRSEVVALLLEHGARE